MNALEGILVWLRRVLWVMTPTALRAAFMAALADAPLPAQTQVMHRHHQERTRAFARAKDASFGLLVVAPDTGQVVKFGIVFYDSLRGQRSAAPVTAKPSDSWLIS